MRAAKNNCLIGPAGGGKSHMLVALGVAAVEAGHRVRYFTARPRREPLPGTSRQLRRTRRRHLLRNDLIIVDELGFAPLDDTGAQLLFRSVAPAYERGLGIGSQRPFESWGSFLPEHITAVSILDRLLHHCHVVVTDGDSYLMKPAWARGCTRVKPS
jgi:DNA replication protein DnaC